jgi:hypothetical protein
VKVDRALEKAVMEREKGGRPRWTEGAMEREEDG